MIPKIIHYCWFGGNEIPQHLQNYIDGWKKVCPDYEIKRWDETNYDYTKNKYMYEAYKAKKWGFVPDYARLDIIYTYGGIYLDTDVELLKPLDALLNYPAFCGVEEEGMVALGLGFGAEKNNKMIKELRDDYDSKSFILPNGRFDITAAPEYQVSFFTKRGLKKTASIQQIESLVVLPKYYLNPIDFPNELNIKEETFSIHHYEGSWVGKSLKLAWKLDDQIAKRKKDGKPSWFIVPVSIMFKVVDSLRVHGLKKTIKVIDNYYKKRRV